MVALIVVLAVVLDLSLAKLHRLAELHHGYYGAALAAVSLELRWPAWVFWLGILLLVDDDVQHVAEALGLRPRMADFTPIHKLGAWIMGLDLKKLGWIAPLGAAVLLGALAVFCAVKFGV